jgi:hypothetical protein
MRIFIFSEFIYLHRNAVRAGVCGGVDDDDEVG